MEQKAAHYIIRAYALLVWLAALGFIILAYLIRNGIDWSYTNLLLYLGIGVPVDLLVAVTHAGNYFLLFACLLLLFLLLTGYGLWRQRDLAWLAVVLICGAGLLQIIFVTRAVAISPPAFLHVEIANAILCSAMLVFFFTPKVKGLFRSAS